MSRRRNTPDNTIVHLYERNDGGIITFYLHYTLPHRGRIRERIAELPRIPKNDPHFDDFKARAQAYQWARTEEIRRGMLGLSAASDIALQDWFGVVADRVKARQRHDVSRHSWEVVVRHTGEIVEAFQHLTVTQVSLDVLRRFSVWITHDYRNQFGKRLSVTTAAKRLAAFSFVMKQAVKDGLIPSNPFDSLDRGERLKPADTERDYLTADELERLESTHTQSQVRDVYLFMCYCGLRISDVKSLRWSDVQQDGGRWWLRIRQQKTQNTLVLPLSASARQYLPTSDGMPPKSLIFDGIPSEPAMNRALKKWARRAGIDKNLTLHTARHTFATLLLTKGADIYTVSKLLGHSNIVTTQIYAKIVDKKKEQAVDLLDTL